MPNIIQLKNSDTAGRAPISLEQGEVAINSTDKQIWVGDPAKNPVPLIVPNNLKLRGTFHGSGTGGTLVKVSGQGITVTRTAKGQYQITSPSIKSSDIIIVDVFTDCTTETGQLINGTGLVNVYNTGFVGRSLVDPDLISIMVLGE